jgi:predicted dehydrogenase
MKPPIKFSVIGLGHIGKRHVEMISRHSDAVLVSLCDNDPGIQNGNYVHQVPVYAELDKLLMDGPEFDVLAIATPNGSHASIALKALAAGKHVIIEKPMALNSEDALNIINQAEKLNKKVFCVMQNRYSPPSVWIKDVIEKKLMGDIVALAYFATATTFCRKSVLR